jgi:methionyl-tRNA formyltransferase
MTVSNRYIVAGAKPWNKRVFDEIIASYAGEWHFVDAQAELTVEKVRRTDPRYIFFMHWSWRVPPEIIDSHACVCFHMTDVPYGRGGSPLQNLILRGHRRTKLTALRMVADFDAGPVYLKKDLCLEGNAEEIYIRASYLSARMMLEIVETEVTPIPQSGEPVFFHRREPGESGITQPEHLHALYDFIRMLDAKGYPVAFIEHLGFRYEFRRASIYDGHIRADVKITSLQGEQ